MSSADAGRSRPKSAKKPKLWHRLIALGMKTGFHMTRYKMYHDIERVLAPLPMAGPKLLAISGSGDLTRLLRQPVAVTHSTFPAESILALPHAANTFDYFMCDQVLEHVCGNPQQAVDETRRVLKPGGIAVLTTCHMSEVHGGKDESVPGGVHDYFRCTMHGLRYLFRDWSEIIAVGSWGNRLAFLPMVRYIPVPHAPWHPLHKLAMWNEPEASISTWIVARK